MHSGRQESSLHMLRHPTEARSSVPLHEYLVIGNVRNMAVAVPGKTKKTFDQVEHHHSYLACGEIYSRVSWNTTPFR